MRSKTGVLVTIGKAQVQVSGFGVGVLVIFCEYGASWGSSRSFWTGVVTLLVVVQAKMFICKYYSLRLG
jgi:hypothetical protein